MTAAHERSVPGRRLHLALPTPDEDLAGLGDVHPADLRIEPDYEHGLVSLQLIEPGQPPVEIVLGVAAAIDVALRIAASAARIRERWRE
jgi:hypothetical protein